MRARRVVEIAGQRRTISEWSSMTGLPETVIRNRLSRGWPMEKILIPLVSNVWNGKKVAGFRHGKDYLSDWSD